MSELKLASVMFIIVFANFGRSTYEYEYKLKVYIKCK